MIKNEKIVKWLCRNCLETGRTTVRIGDVAAIVGSVIAGIAIMSAIATIVSFVVGILGNAMIYEFDVSLMPSHRMMVLQGAGFIVVAVSGSYAVIRILSVEIAECPLQKGEDDQEETK